MGASLDFYVQMLVAVLSMALGFALWHRGMPPVIAARGRLQAMATWAEGMALAVFGGVFLTNAMADQPISALPLFGQLCLIASAAAHLIRATNLGPQRWATPRPRSEPGE